MRLRPIEHQEPRTQIAVGTFYWILTSFLCASASLSPPTAVLIILLLCLPVTSEFTHPQFQSPHEKLPYLSSRFKMPGRILIGPV